MSCIDVPHEGTDIRGCDTGQGWLYSRPVPPDRISELLGARAYAVGNP
ncbi:hypothetical protein ACWDA8_27025 [Streptomyces sp. NPDC001130]